MNALKRAPERQSPDWRFARQLPRRGE